MPVAQKFTGRRLFLILICYSSTLLVAAAAVIGGGTDRPPRSVAKGQHRETATPPVRAPCLTTLCTIPASGSGSYRQDAFMSPCTLGWFGSGRSGERLARARVALVAGVVRVAVAGRIEVEGGCMVRGLLMKANNKNKRKREQRVEGDSGGAGDSMPRPSLTPQRVSKHAPISVRAQIKYARLKKTLQKAHTGSLKKVPNTYRRAKRTDYEDIVEPEDLSTVYMPNIAPSLMVDGYNILHHWPKTRVIADRGDLEGARIALLEEVDTLSAMRGWTVTVVFDAYKTKGNGHTYTTPNKVTVVYTGDGQSADMYVERQTMDLKDAGCPSVMVATGDRLMQSLVADAGAQVLSPDRLVEEIEISHQEAAAYSRIYMQRKEKMMAKSDGKKMCNSVRHVDKGSSQNKRANGGGKGGKGGHGDGPSFSIEDDFDL